MLSILSINELTLQKKLQHFMTIYVFRTNKSKHNNNLPKRKHRNAYHTLSWESNPGPFGPQSDALPLDQRDN